MATPTPAAPAPAASEEGERPSQAPVRLAIQLRKQEEEGEQGPSPSPLSIELVVAEENAPPAQQKPTARKVARAPAGAASSVIGAAEGAARAAVTVAKGTLEAASKAGAAARPLVAAISHAAAAGPAGPDPALRRLEGAKLLLVCGRISAVMQGLLEVAVSHGAELVVLATRDVAEGRRCAARILAHHRPPGPLQRVVNKGMHAVVIAGTAGARALGAATAGTHPHSGSDQNEQPKAEAPPSRSSERGEEQQPRAHHERRPSDAAAVASRKPTRIVCDRVLGLVSSAEVQAYTDYVMGLLESGEGDSSGAAEGAVALGEEQESGGGEEEREDMNSVAGGRLTAVVIDAPSLAPRPGSNLGKRWYSEEGTPGMAQLHYAGPYALLRRLEPLLVSSQARVVVAASLLHRLATVPSPRGFLTRWHEASGPRCQLATASLAYETQRRLGPRGVTACVTDTGVTREDLAAAPWWLSPVPPAALRALWPLFTPAAEAAATVAHAVAAEWDRDAKGRGLLGLGKHVTPEHDLRLYSRGLRASPAVTALNGPAVTWPILSSLAHPAYSASLLALAAADAPTQVAAGAALRAGARALPRWAQRWLSGVLAPHVVAPAPGAADPLVGRALWEGAAGALRLGGDGLGPAGGEGSVRGELEVGRAEEEEEKQVEEEEEQAVGEGEHTFEAESGEGEGRGEAVGEEEDAAEEQQQQEEGEGEGEEGAAEEERGAEAQQQGPKEGRAEAATSAPSGEAVAA